jgi:hypothetical protein
VSEAPGSGEAALEHSRLALKQRSDSADKFPLKQRSDSAHKIPLDQRSGGAGKNRLTTEAVKTEPFWNTATAIQRKCITLSQNV